MEVKYRLRWIFTEKNQDGSSSPFHVDGDLSSIYWVYNILKDYYKDTVNFHLNEISYKNGNFMSVENVDKKFNWFVG